MARSSPLGNITRGTTNPNRLRRVDRWLIGTQLARLRSCPTPVVVDLGYGASPITVVELWSRVRSVCPAAEVVGIEIDPARVAAAEPLAAEGLRFIRGGFEVPYPGDASVIRAFNVLRQYAEDEVAEAWHVMTERLAPDGILIDGTCDELGRLSSWITIERAGPVALTLSWRLQGLTAPSVIAERFPKALIHRNVPGEPVHAFVTALDRAWEVAAAQGSFGVRQRFLAAVDQVRDAGWAIEYRPHRWRLGELTIAWDEVAPQTGPLASLP